jgi:fluoride exporter
VPVRPAVLLAVAAGGMVGALARYAAARAWPVHADGFPWTTLAVNASGCLLIGVLMVLLTERDPAHPLLQPALGTGVLGGYTTFSAYAVELERLLEAGRVGTGLAYGGVTPVVALAAAAAGAALARRVTGTPR